MRVAAATGTGGRERRSRGATSEQAAGGAGRQRWSVLAHPPLPARAFRRAAWSHPAACVSEGGRERGRRGDTKRIYTPFAIGFRGEAARKKGEAGRVGGFK